MNQSLREAVKRLFAEGKVKSVLGYREHPLSKAVVATLWPVDDASVGLLMAAFYKLWVTTPGIEKAEALRQAQLALLHGASAQPPSSPYANPFYWAPFVLIGNWK